MGVMKFQVPRRERMAPDTVERAYLCGMDEIPWQSRTQWAGPGLIVERSQGDSGNFFVPYPVAGHGELVLSTASLMERDRPYLLPVELARGTLNRLRNQIAAWEPIGLAVPATVRAAMHQALEQFSGAAARQNDVEAATDFADLAIRSALEAMNLLSSAYVEQALAARHQAGGQLTTLVGCKLGSAVPSPAMTQQLTAAFNTVTVPLSWREIEAHEGKQDWTTSDQQIEWARAHGLKVCSGPLLQIDKWTLPDWMYLWGEDDEENFRSCVAEHIRAVVTRYRGKVQLWQCAARLNIHNDFGQGEEQRLRLAVLAVENIRRVDPRAPIVITVDQPWGSFMSREDCDLSPLHFADALVRGDLGLSGIGLEINLGYTPGGSEPRDVLEFGRQMDRWSSLGLPLLIGLTAASAAGADPLARVNPKTVNYSASDQLSAAAQRAWAERYFQVLLAKQPVQGIIWNQLLDSQPHALPHGGLFDAQDRAKPILGVFEALRRQHLM